MYVPKLKTVDLIQEGSQCPGTHVFEYAVCPFGGGTAASVINHAASYNLPKKVAQSGKQCGNLPMQMSFLNVSDPLTLSAVKKAESRDTIIVRLYNPLNKDAEGCLNFYRPLASVYLLNMEEERLEKIKVSNDHSVKFPIGSKKIITLELELKPGYGENGRD
jgi:alpha-mannosidase